MTRGISAIGVYLPRRRMSRRAIGEALAWRSQTDAGRGERAYGNWDEDALTMAVEAGRVVLSAESGIDSLTFASTTHPFLDRSNVGIAAEALGLPASLRTQDAGGSQRAAVSALVAQLESTSEAALLIAADRRTTRPGSAQESAYGDGAAALLVGNGAELAEYLGSVSENIDFVDHYRAAGHDQDYALEERWVRSEAWGPFVRRGVESLLGRIDLTREAVTRVIIAAPRPLSDSVVRSLELPNAQSVDACLDRIGDCGVAHPLIMLAGVLEQAEPGEIVLLVALRVRSTRDAARSGSLSKSLAEGVTDQAYVRFLSHSGALALDAGMRGERDARTAHSAHYRKHSVLNGFEGGRCSACGTVQFPPAPACVNPECRAFAEQMPVRLADTAASVKTYTEDWLAYTPAPPLVYGNAAFEGGGNAFIEFTDVDPGETSVGAALRFVFRIKDVDHVRGFHRYFWKATLRRS